MLKWNKQSHPVKSKKRRKLRSIIILCEKSSTSQIGFYSISISTLNTLLQCFHRAIDEIAIHKNFQFKFFYKKAFPWQYDKVKRKFLYAHQLFFPKNKMILVHHVLNFFHVTLKQEINLTLPYNVVFFLKRKKKNTCIYHYQNLDDMIYMIYSSWAIEQNILKLVILGYLFPFYPHKNPKIKILKTEKICWRYHHFTQITIIWCAVPEIWSETGKSFCHFGPLFTLSAPWQPRKSKF